MNAIELGAIVFGAIGYYAGLTLAPEEEGAWWAANNGAIAAVVAAPIGGFIGWAAGLM